MLALADFMTISGAPGASKQRVLVVDDDPTITRMLDLMLRKMLYVDVDVANTAFGILNRIDTTKPNVVVLDVMMPAPGWDRGHGTDPRRLGPRAPRRCCCTPRWTSHIACSGAAECRADGYAQKGTRPAELAQRIGTWLRDSDRHA